MHESMFCTKKVNMEDCRQASPLRFGASKKRQDLEINVSTCMYVHQAIDHVRGHASVTCHVPRCTTKTRWSYNLVTCCGASMTLPMAPGGHLDSSAPVATSPISCRYTQAKCYLQLNISIASISFTDLLYMLLSVLLIPPPRHARGPGLANT
jgi:hypothetical protein